MGTPTSSKPLVTIGLPVFNSARYVAQSIESLLDQTYRDFELIISDNASTDDTARICQHYASLDRRVRYTRNDVNIGNPRNFNRIATLTTTPFLKWSTADDYWAPTFLERAMEVMLGDDSIVLCYPQATLVDAAGANPTPYDDVLHLVDNDPAERFIRLLTTIRLAHQHLGIIRMAQLRRIALLGTHVASDINLLAELTLYGKFFELPERLFFRRFHKDSGSWKRGDKEHEARRYHAAGKKAVWLKWPRHLGLISAVKRSDLPLGSKVRLYRFLSRQMVWDRGILGAELGAYLKTVLR